MVRRSVLPVLRLTVLACALHGGRSQAEPSCEAFSEEDALMETRAAEPSPEFDIDEGSLMQTRLGVIHSGKKRGKALFEENVESMSAGSSGIEASKGNMSSKISSNVTNGMNSTVDTMSSAEVEEDKHAACMKDVTHYFNGAYPCLVQQMCNYTIRVRCSSITPGGYWDYAPKDCCQLPPPEFGTGPCESKCTVVKL
mmetsp:Transcript_110773/g.196241  ORF Transcript_110773/g.196241 Transcript_110773/m.196241 type:complete len:197 (-) Transcript_110773:36-626(-)